MADVKLKLIGQDWLDDYGDEGVEYVRQSIDFQKPDMNWMDHSQPFTLPASKKNNKLFQHYYNVSVVGGFNPYVKNPAELWVNTDLQATGAMILLSVEMRNGKATQYQVQFYSDTINLSAALDGVKIAGLGWTDYNHNLSTQDAANYLSGDIAFFGGVSMRYPMMSMSNAWVWEYNTIFDLEGVRQIKRGQDGILNREVRPAMPFSHLIERIFEAAGYDYEIVFATEQHWLQLHFWVNNSKPMTTRRLVCQVGPQALQQFFSTGQVIKWPNTISDELGLYNGILNEIVISESADYDLVLNFDFTGSLGEWRYLINGVAVNAWTFTGGGTFTTNMGTLNIGDRISVELRNATGLGAMLQLELTSWMRVESSGTSQLDYVDVGSFMPDIDCMDVLKGMLVTFNAIMYWDAVQNKFIITHRDQWYRDGNIVDITKWVDNTAMKVEPPTIYSSFSFSNAEAEPFRNTEYKAANGKQYGSGYFNTGLFLGDEYATESPFTQTVWAELVTEDNKGFQVPPASGIASSQSVDSGFDKVESGLTLMYYNGLRDGLDGNYEVVDIDGVNGVQELTYCLFLNTLISQDLQLTFNPEFDFQWQNAAIPNNTLFSRFYGDYIAAIYDATVRQITLTALIPYSIQRTIKINDTIQIRDNLFLINKITVNLLTEESIFELINVAYDRSAVPRIGLPYTLPFQVA